MTALLKYGLAALGAGLVGWWWWGAPKKPYVPPGVKPGTPLAGTFVDRPTAEDDFLHGALDGAVRGYDAGKVGGDAAAFHPETDTLIQPSGVASFRAYAAGYPCGARKGFALGQRMRALVGAAGAAGTTFDSTTADARTAMSTACAATFAAWWAKYGGTAEPALAHVAGWTGLLSPQVAPTLRTTTGATGRTFLTFARPHRV